MDDDDEAVRFFAAFPAGVQTRHEKTGRTIFK